MPFGTNIDYKSKQSMNFFSDNMKKEINERAAVADFEIEGYRVSEKAIGAGGWGKVYQGKLI